MASYISKLRKYIPTCSLALLSLSFLAIIFVFLIDYKILNISPLTEGSPNFELIYLFRTVLIVMASIFFVSAVAKINPYKDKTYSIENVSTEWGDWGVVLWSEDQITNRTIISIYVKDLIVWTVLFASLFFLFIFLWNPKIFYKLGSEDNPVENISAALWFLNCGLCVYSTVILYQKIRKNRLVHMMITISFSIIFFLVGMEEVSWFQRALNIGTPELFIGNDQNEMNLHNFATNPIENIYYFFSFVFLIVLPFFFDRILTLKERGSYYLYVPKNFIIFVSAIFVAYNYDMWNILFTQFSFFTTIFILFYYAFLYKHLCYNRFVMLAVIIVIVLTQILFIVFGGNFVRLWDVTEYKEMFIPLAFLMYSVEIVQNLIRFKGSVTTADLW